MTWMFVSAALGLGVVTGFTAYYVYARRSLANLENEKLKAQEEAKKLIEIAKKEAELQVKDKVLQLKTEIEKETRGKRDELAGMEKRLSQKEESLEKKSSLIDSKESELSKREKSVAGLERSVAEKQSQMDGLINEQRKTLERIAHYTAEEAKRDLMAIIEEDAKRDSARRLREVEEEYKENATKKAQEYVSLAIQRLSGDIVAEHTVSGVALPSDEMKGRIIGREGRNIRAFEAATGVDVIIDDTPEAVVISSHNPVRREIARVSLERLIHDGRIHPARIEEIVEKVKVEIEQTIKETGEKTLFDVGIHNVNPDLVRLIGMLRYRTSYGQNILQHSVEVAHICGVLAAELNLPVKHAKRAGLLHDIGKAIDAEVEGSHAMIGADLLKKYGENPKLINAVASHHGEEAPNSVIAVLVQAADGLSAARPGARRESLQSYLKRVEELEKIAVGFPGVHKAYAIQAGREVRVIVENSKVNDDEAFVLARDIAKKVEGEMTYPGQIKVTVVRETRAVEYAK